MSRVRLSKAAEADLDEIWLYIARDSVRAASQLIDLVTPITVKFSMLAASPGMGRQRDGVHVGVRSFAVRAYLIYYRRTRGRIHVIRVLHAARDPEGMFDR